MIEYTVKVDNGTKSWFLNGKKHREDGPAIEYANGYKAWYINGELHREDGPAIEYSDGDKYWFINGERHREDGPAIENANGTKYWYLSGVKYTEEEHYNKLNPAKELTMKINVVELNKDFRNSRAKNIDFDLYYESELMPGVVGINIGCNRWKDIIVKKNGERIGRLTVDSSGLRVLDENGDLIEKISNWIEMGFKILLERLGYNFKIVE